MEFPKEKEKILLGQTKAIAFVLFSDLLSSLLSLKFPATIKKVPLGSHCAPIILLNSVFITFGSLSFSSSKKRTTPLLKAIIKCFEKLLKSLILIFSFIHTSST